MITFIEASYTDQKLHELFDTWQERGEEAEKIIVEKKRMGRGRGSGREKGEQHHSPGNQAWNSRNERWYWQEGVHEKHVAVIILGSKQKLCCG